MRRRQRALILWAGLGLLGAVALWWSVPRLFPLLPGGWSVDRGEAEAIALARMADLGEPVRGAYVVTRLRTDAQLERRLQLLAPAVGRDAILASPLAELQAAWEVTVWAPGARVRDWSYQAWVSRDGDVALLRGRTPSAEGPVEDDAVLDDATAVAAARDLLADQGFELADYDAEPQVLRETRDGRVETRVRLRDRGAALGELFPYGVEVFFEGDETRGFGPWLDDPRRAELQGTLAQNQLANLVRVVVTYLLLPLVAVPFLRRYHEGEIGVRRGVHLFLACLGAAALWIAMNAGAASAGTNFGLIPRRQTSWLIAGFFLVFQSFGLAVIGFMSWSLGEATCRARWPQKLAALDAVFRLKWDNATVARSAFQGLAGGLAMAGGLSLLAAWGQARGIWPMAAFFFGDGVDGPLPGLGILLLAQGILLPLLLFLCLLLPAWSTARLGWMAGLAATTLGIALVVPILLVMPLSWAWTFWALVAPIPAILFRWGDALASLLAPFACTVLISALPLLLADHGGLQVQGWAALVVLFSPLLLSLRHLGTEREFVYTWDDIPPHVRRIAERERQRVELETARNIQSSILPELPPSVNGVEIAHTYLPASEVGGDFYDVLALDDGRVALAVGDVAGHGVASGLVMSMARSALAVQVTFDPDVGAVLRTLNRMVYQSARRRLLSTLLYAIVDPAHRHLLYASAGHVFPYRITADGRVEELESIAYPLGVRHDMEVRVRARHLEPGDTVFLYSDGLVEARPEGSDEPFGFERLEASLARHADLAPPALRDAVLADLRDYVGHGPQDDDLTALVLRLPAA